MTPEMLAEMHRHIRQHRPEVKLPTHDITKQKQQQQQQQQQQSQSLTSTDDIYQHGKALLYGDGVKKDVTQGVSLVTPLALASHFPSQFLLALYYRDTGSPDVCLDWCERACQHIEPRAWILYATVLEQEGYIEDAVEWYIKAADKGIMAAASKAGILLASSDPSRSHHYIEMAARGGVAEAQYAWGMMIEDAMESYEWIKSAAKQGHAEACYVLSDYIKRGHGCLRNSKDAQRWFQRAIENGYGMECRIMTPTSSGRNSPISNRSSILSTSTSTSPSTSTIQTPGNTPPIQQRRGKLIITTTPSFTFTSPTGSTDVSPSIEEMEQHRHSLSTRNVDIIMTTPRDVECDEIVEEDEDVECPMFHDE